MDTQYILPHGTPEEIRREVKNSIGTLGAGRTGLKSVECFPYNPSTTVLNNISFAADSSDVVALVGHSGAGKTTIANLIPRFYDCKEGEILINDINIKNYGLKSLRSQIGIVSQNVILFNTTIMENIR